jgi:zinc/manganese transport system permease protein
MHWVLEPGFVSSAPVRTALVIGAVVAVVSAVVGVFTVVRGQSFAGHALTDVATTGGSAAFLLSVNPLLGFIGGCVIGSGAMDVIGVQRVRGRDVATGIVLGASTGMAALFLYLSATSSSTTGVSQQILFGSIFTISSSTIAVVVLLGAGTLALLAAAYRPLLLSSVSPDIAAARGVRVRLVGVGFLASLAVAVGLASLAIGSILSTALLIGPPATALRLTKRVASAMLVASLIGAGSTWAGILLAYDSYYWGSSQNGLPVSFFIVGVIFLVYLASGLRPGRRNAARTDAAGDPHLCGVEAGTEP